MHKGWESAEILKLIISDFKSFDNQLKPVEVLGQLSQLMQETPPI